MNVTNNDKDKKSQHIISEGHAPGTSAEVQALMTRPATQSSSSTAAAAAARTAAAAPAPPHLIRETAALALSLFHKRDEVAQNARAVMWESSAPWDARSMLLSDNADIEGVKERFAVLGGHWERIKEMDEKTDQAFGEVLELLEAWEWGWEW